MANNTIKGLTVEIGGDTTKLGKALEDVNKKSRDLSSELGQINKLLKLDPGNADLLAQKQKVLADAVENTAQKLETLREAEKQVQRQFEKGEVSEEQVRALQREIVATSNKLKTYERAAQETADAVAELGDSSGKVSSGARETEQGADRAADSLDDYADSADKAADASDGLGATLGGAVKTGLTALATGVAAAVGAMVASAEASREYRTEIGKLEAAFTDAGHESETATETYRTLQGVLGETEQAVEASNHLAKLCETEDELATWTETLTGVYATFGASLPIEGLAEAANETVNTGAVTGALADALNWAGISSKRWAGIMKENEAAQAAFTAATEEGLTVEEAFNEALAACSDEQERAALITDALSGAYQEAAWTYQDVNAEIIRANEANELWMASMAEVGGAIEPVLTDVKMLGASLLSDLVPGVQGVAEAFRGMLNGEDGAAANLGVALSGIFEQLLAKIAELLPQAAEMAISLITTLTTSIIEALPQLLSTGAQMVSTLISGLMSALPQILTTGGQVLAQLLSGIATGLPNVLQQAIDIIGSLVSGLQQNLPLILAQGSEILVNLSKGIAQNLPSLFSQALDILMDFATTIYDNAPALIETGFEVLTNLVTGIINCIPDLLAKGPEIISKFANVINDNFPTILKKGVELVLQIIKGLIQAIPELIANIPKIITAIVDVWEAFNWTALGKKAITFLKNGVTGMVASVKTAGKNVLDAIVNALKNLPTQLGNFGKNAMSGLGNALKSGLGSVKSGATNIFNAVVNTIKSLPSKMLSIGKDLVRGLWNGISDMVGWITGKIQSFGDRVMDGIKDFFGIESPSKLMRDDVGKMLSAGVAEGITAGEKLPLKAISDLSQDVMAEAENMDGLTLERKLQHTFTAPDGLAGVDTGMLAKLDAILEAIKAGQILTLDSGRLVGGTANRYDSALGQRRILVERGAV